MSPKTAGRSGGTSRVADPITPASSTPVGPYAGSPPGFVSGALVMTMRGSRPAQDLKPGMRVITRNNGAVPILRIEQTSLVARAIYVLAGSLGHRRLDRDTLMPAGQTVFVRDWRARVLHGSPEMLSHAGDLIDGEFIRDLGLQPMTIYRVYCDGPQILYADGMELGSADAAAHSARSDVTTKG